MLGQSIVVLDEQLVRVFGSLAAVGAISWLSYARRIMLVPVGVVAQAAGVAGLRNDLEGLSVELHRPPPRALPALADEDQLWAGVNYRIAKPNTVVRFAYGQLGRDGADDRDVIQLTLQLFKF